MTSNNLKRKKPSPVIIQSCLVENVSVVNNRNGKNVSAWPANSSATTSDGSILPVAAITAGENLMQMIEPANIKIVITMDIARADVLNWHIRAKINAGGNEPYVPGATGSQPRPKQDVSNLFIVAVRLTEGDG